MIETSQLLREIEDGEKKAISFVVDEHTDKMRAFVLRNNGGNDDVHDLMQEALYHLYRNSCKRPRIVVGNFHAYFAAIYRNLWMKQLNQKARRIRSEQKVEEVGETEDVYYYSYLKAFQKLGVDCQKVLNYYINGTNISEMAALLNTSADYAKRKKYLCKEKLKKLAINELREGEK